ncbi:trypsin-like peptidase domain-containing protein [uncultured Methanospirillum sp.]|uniref:trypsin-like peptidase domain-containing protein n=1 Tax=uncultured Methanospirillum sp. TaxID=262503 RepID=UPI0029C956C1|nr:trypsin-like peptidase domain-containing protein [uncultured Methanospirillum sp.]
MIKPISLSEKLLFSTVRIEVNKTDTISIGTAFFFNINTKNGTIPLIFTNKHVVRNGVQMNILLHTSVKEGDIATPLKESFEFSIFDCNKNWTNHPDSTIDLCVMPIASLIKGMKEQGKDIFYIPLEMNCIYSDEKLEELSAVENVLMIGYPRGLWDKQNNLPLIRKGITATHPAIDHNGKSLGMVDMACFPGSSGSPILVVNEGSHNLKKGTLVIGDRLILLGILFSGPVIDNDGNIRELENDQSTTSGENQLLIHLGYYIKAKEISELINFFLEKNNIRI